MAKTDVAEQSPPTGRTIEAGREPPISVAPARVAPARPARKKPAASGSKAPRFKGGPGTTITKNESEQASPSIRAKPVRKKKNRLLIDLIGWVGGAVAALALGYYLINSGLIGPGNETEIADEDTVVIDSQSRTHPERDRGPLDPPVDTDPDKGSNDRPIKPNNVADNGSKTNSLSVTHITDSGTPNVAANNNSNDDNTLTGNTSPNKREVKPAAPMLPAPWTRRNRFTIRPPNFNSFGQGRDQALLTAIRMAISQREYLVASQNWPKVAASATKMNPPIDLGRTVADLNRFWSKVKSSAGMLRVGDKLDFAGTPVKVSRVSQKSLELQYEKSKKTFRLEQKLMDRDLAIALANRDRVFDPKLTELFVKNDFVHLRLPLPSILSSPSNTNVVRPGNFGPGPASTANSKPTKRAAVPEDRVVRGHQKELKELYPKEYEDQRILSQKSFAERLLRNARSNNNESMVYALLKESMDISSEIGDGMGALTALKEIDSRFRSGFLGPFQESDFG